METAALANLLFEDTTSTLRMYAVYPVSYTH